MAFSLVWNIISFLLYIVQSPLNTPCSVAQFVCAGIIILALVLVTFVKFKIARSLHVNIKMEFQLLVLKWVLLIFNCVVSILGMVRLFVLRETELSLLLRKVSKHVSVRTKGVGKEFTSPVGLFFIQNITGILISIITVYFAQRYFRKKCQGQCTGTEKRATAIS